MTTATATATAATTRAQAAPRAVPLRYRKNVRPIVADYDALARALSEYVTF